MPRVMQATKFLQLGTDGDDGERRGNVLRGHRGQQFLHPKYTPSGGGRRPSTPVPKRRARPGVYKLQFF